jgi:hypothetical protein
MSRLLVSNLYRRGKPTVVAPILVVLLFFVGIAIGDRLSIRSFPTYAESVVEPLLVCVQVA